MSSSIIRTVPTQESGCKGRLVVIEPIQILRQGLAVSLAHAQYEIICQARSLEDVDNRAELADAVIIDLDLNRTKGASTLLEARKRLPDARLITIGLNQDIKTIAEVYRAGAAAFLPIDTDFELVTEAIDSVIDGKIYSLPDLANELIGYFSGQQRETSPHKPRLRKLLSRTEYAVLMALYDEQPLENIAKDLELSEHSVRTRISTIRKKLNLSNQLLWKLAVDELYDPH